MNKYSLSTIKSRTGWFAIFKYGKLLMFVGAISVVLLVFLQSAFHFAMLAVVYFCYVSTAIIILSPLLFYTYGYRSKKMQSMYIDKCISFEKEMLEFHKQLAQDSIGEIKRTFDESVNLVRVTFDDLLKNLSPQVKNMIIESGKKRLSFIQDQFESFKNQLDGLKQDDILTYIKIMSKQDEAVELAENNIMDCISSLKKIDQEVVEEYDKGISQLTDLYERGQSELMEDVIERQDNLVTLNKLRQDLA